MIDIRHQYLLKLLENNSKNFIELAANSLTEIELDQLPMADSLLWEKEYTRNQGLIAQLWLVRTIDEINTKSVLELHDSIFYIWKHRRDWIKKTRSYWTDTLFNSVGNTTLAVRAFQSLLKPTDLISKFVQAAWFDERQEATKALKELMPFSIVNVYSTSSVALEVAIHFAQKLKNDEFNTEEEHTAWAYLHFMWGALGREPFDGDLEKAWYGAAYYHNILSENTLSEDLVSQRFELLKSEPISTRLFLYNELLKIADSDNGTHPYPSSIIARWAVLSGCEQRPTFYDGIKALVPELTKELSNLEAIGVDAGSSCVALQNYNDNTTNLSIHLPTGFSLV